MPYFWSEIEDKVIQEPAGTFNIHSQQVKKKTLQEWASHCRGKATFRGSNLQSKQNNGLGSTLEILFCLVG